MTQEQRFSAYVLVSNLDGPTKHLARDKTFDAAVYGQCISREATGPSLSYRVDEAWSGAARQ